MSRHSIRNTLRLTRGARNAASRAGVRYSKDDTVALLLGLCMALLNDAEKALLEANRRAAMKRERRAA